MLIQPIQRFSYNLALELGAETVSAGEYRVALARLRNSKTNMADRSLVVVQNWTEELKRLVPTTH